MSDDKSNLSKIDPIGEFASLYEEKPLLRALFALVAGFAPFSSAGIPLLEKGVKDITQERTKVFFDELEMGNIPLTKELLEKEAFLHSFFSTWRAASRAKNREKIRMFARLLLSATKEGELDGDILEEFTNVLNDMSPRELIILLILRRFEYEYPPLPIDINTPEDGLMNWAKRARRFWEKFVEAVESECNVPHDHVPAMLNRLVRTGFYEIFVGMYIDIEPGMGHLTPSFTEFMRWIETEDKKNKRN